MAEKKVQQSKYKYELNASLVIQGSQAGAPRQDNEPSGEGTTLAGTTMAQFGDRVARSKPTELKEKAVKKLEQQAKHSHKEVLKRRKGAGEEGAVMIDTEGGAPGIGASKDVLNVEIQEDLVYRPRTKETRAIYEQMLMIVQRHMGDYSLEIIKGALDEIIAILKAEGLKDTERKTEIEGLIDRLNEGDFNSLTVLGQHLTDYQPSTKVVGQEEE